ncbi:ectonucleoside triphosphate diphosphohydrolase 8-like isoform X2 [Serinus canaria]|nr:ectonucleoside triphosphate diphosphohydrolase 8-like isoform X2 [Serinus canaria]XP_050836879.1 ectonucleoside triphosphate diphosphohydrolase 8-like isoform X2 [Serinus canaria]
MDSKAKAIAGLLAATCVCSIIALILSIVNVKDVLLPPCTKYGLVFDAGSTHTSLYTYQWRANKENDTGIVSQVEACSVSGPGISSYADDPAGAGASLKPCLDRAMKIIPAEQQRETPTYLGATAGMRLLREENSSKAEQVLVEVSKAIGEYPVDFRGARILTGSEEGSFGWITVNYLLETLVKFSFAEKWEHPQDIEVLGALDLGGASTQITFQPGVPVEDRNTSVFFRLYGTNYSLYSHSYLCYGQSQALKMLLAALHQVPQGTGAAQPSPSAVAHLPLQRWACLWAKSWELAEPWVLSREAKNCLIWVEGGGGCQPGLPSPHILTCSGIFCNFPSPAVCVVFLLSPCSWPCSISAQREVSQHSPCTTARGQRQSPGLLRELPGGVHPVLLGCSPAFWDGLWEGSQWRCSPINGSIPLQASLSTQIKHPCYPQGYQENITVAELYDSPCVHAPSSASPGPVLTVTGTGDPAACATAIRSLFNFTCRAQGPCGFNGVYQPPVRGQFFAFAGFYYAFNFLNLTRQQSLSEVNTTVLSFCRRNWIELVQSFPGDLKYLHTYCSVAFYILTLLLDGYKFNEHTWSNIHFSRQAANTDIGWTLGFMLNLTNMIPTEALQHVKGHQPDLWAGAISFLTLAIVAGLVAVFLHCFWKTK